MKQERVLELFLRGLRGEDTSVKDLSVEYNVSTKSISRDINDLKALLADQTLLGIRNFNIPIRTNAIVS